MTGQPAVCGGVGAANPESNHARTAGEKMREPPVAETPVAETPVARLTREAYVQLSGPLSGPLARPIVGPVGTVRLQRRPNSPTKKAEDPGWGRRFGAGVSYG